MYKFVYVLCTKTIKIKILYDNECTKNEHQIPTYIQKMYKLCKTQIKNGLKLEMFFVHTNNVQNIKNLYN